MTTITFDLETTGLSADSEITSFAMVSDDKIYCLSQCLPGQDGEIDEKCLLKTMHEVVSAKDKGTVLCTYNGGNYQGGFDFPLLRTRFHKHGVAWPFAGMMHVDLYPVIVKRWSTAQQYWQSIDQMLVDDLKKMIVVFGVEGKAKVKQNYIDLIVDTVPTESIDLYIKENFEPKIRDINSLKGAYQIITGKDPGEIDGAGAIELWLQYKETGDDKYLIELRQYNIKDCQKTLELYDICKEFCSKRDMQPDIL